MGNGQNVTSSSTASAADTVTSRNATASKEAIVALVEKVTKVQLSFYSLFGGDREKLHTAGFSDAVTAFTVAVLVLGVCKGV